ncbi:MAG: metallophosphoesterase [Clostridia bacterium]|nr:metallophosphoesterase [Clostridia bacterium]
MSVLQRRFLLVSDMHYTTEETTEELKRVYPDANTSAAAGNAFGKTQKEKIEKLLGDILEEHSRSPLDAVFVLGDLSIDDADFRNLPWNFCRKFREDCMDKLPCPAYALPGNHDSYSDAHWRGLFGYGRQFTAPIGDCVFIMADTFRDVPAAGASGSPHTPLDPAFLRFCFRIYAGKKLFLCAHHLEDSTFGPEVRAMIRKNPDLVCMFRGHVHKNSVTDMGPDLGGKLLFDIGGYGYEGRVVNGRYDFNYFDFAWAWGYQILEIYDDRIRTYHVKVQNHYDAVNGIFDVPETVEDERIFPLHP